MTSTLFDILGESDVQVDEEIVEEKQQKKQKSEPNQGQIDFFSLAEEQPQQEEKQEPSYARSVLNAIPKGFLKGIIRFGRMLGPLPDEPEGFGDGSSDFDEEKLFAQFEEMFPTSEDALPGAIERGLSIAPSILGSPGGAANLTGTSARIAASAGAGEAAKQADMPKWVQDVAEVIPLIAPSLKSMNKAGASESDMAKYIAENAPEGIANKIKTMISKDASKKELLDFARQAGMTEAEITPLLQGEFKQKFLTKLASKGESTQAKLKATKESLGNVFNSIKESPAAQKTLSEGQSTRLVKGLQDRMKQMPSSVRNVIKEDLQKLLEGEMTGEKAIKFFRDVNHELGPKTKQLSTLKEPIKKALMEIDPELGRSFDLTNKLYGKYAEIAKKLKPNALEGLISKGKGGAALLGLVTGNVGALKGIAAYEGSRKVAEHMLTNPRMQDLGSKMVSALNQNKFAVAEHIKTQMINEIKDVDPSVARALEELNIKGSED